MLYNRSLSTISTFRVTKGTTWGFWCFWRSNFCFSYWLLYLDNYAFVLTLVLELLAWPLIEQSPEVERSLSVSPVTLYERCWWTSGGVWLPIKAPRCFFLLGGPSTRQGSRDQAFGRCLFMGRILRYQWLPRPHIPCCPRPRIRYSLNSILFSSSGKALSTRPFLVMSYSNSDMWNTLCIFYLVGSSSLYACLPTIWKTRKSQKTCSWATCSSLFWCIFYSARPFCLERSYGS